MTSSHALDTRVDFVGREPELAQLRGVLQRSGCITLTGPGGVGKSRLAHEAALRAQRDNARDVTFIALSGGAGDEVFGAVALALGIREELGRNPQRVLRHALSGSNALLVIDNCEHVPDESSALMEMLGSIDGVAAIATSQCRLDYPDERIIEVAPFDGTVGTEFFIARARVAGITIATEERATVTRIVDRLDGLAIALDLAAARLATLGIEALSSELERLRPYSFRTTGKAERRHWSIGRVVEWTCSHLDSAAQSAFVIAASFQAPFTRADLQALIGGDTVATDAAVTALLAHSLLFENDGKLSMLAPIRAVALRTLAARSDRRIYEERLAVRMTELARANQTASIPALAERYGDFTASLAWGLKRPAERLARVADVATALVRVWADGGRFDDGLRWVERLIEVAPSLPPAVRADLYYLAIRVFHAASHFERMLAIGPTAISSYQITGNTFGLARAYNALAVASLYTNRTEDAQKYVETAVAIFERIGDKRGLGSALSNYGNVLLEGRMDPKLAYGCYEKALTLLMEYGDDNLVGITYGNMAECAAYLEDFETSLQHARQACERFAATQNAGMLGWMRQVTARVHLERGDLAAARAELLLACDLLTQSTQLHYIAMTAETAAAVLLESSAVAHAAILFNAAGRLRRERRLPPTAPEAHAIAERLLRVDETLSPAERSWAEAEAAAIEAAHLPVKARAYLA